jgi:hypothetical protein
MESQVGLPELLIQRQLISSDELERVSKLQDEQQAPLTRLVVELGLISEDEFQAKKTLLENKVNLIKKLKAEQKGPVHMLDEISKALPDFVWLTGMDEQRGNTRVTGQSNSLAAVADFIQGLQRSGWFPRSTPYRRREQQHLPSTRVLLIRKWRRSEKSGGPGRPGAAPPGAKKVGRRAASHTSLASSSEVAGRLLWRSSAAPQYL